MTSNKEEYLKVLYENNGAKLSVPNKLIADAMGVAPSSVTEMLNKLKEEGLVTTQPYKGSMLTEEGLMICLTIMRSEQLWEVFLVEHLGYSWREAHEDAHLLEHVTPSRLMDRLDEFLGHPKTCPHGALILREDNKPPKKPLTRLSDLRKGSEAIIRRVDENVTLLDYLQRIDFKIGVEIKILEVSDYDGPIKYLEGKSEKSISFKASKEVYVEALF